MAVKTFEGDLQAGSARFGVVVSRFNDLVTRMLLNGAVGTLARYGVPEERVEIAWVPGCWEIPLAAREMVERNDAVICLGVILKGETPHAGHLAASASNELGRLARKSGKPVSWGILTCDDLNQALARAGAKMGNKGAEAALAALEMVSLLAKLRQGGA